METMLMVIGQRTPPVHGSNVMTEILVESLRNAGYRVLLVQKTFSERQEDIAKLRFKKIFKIPIIYLKLLRTLIQHKPSLCIFFLSLKSPSFYFDSSLVMFLKIFRTNCVLYLHGQGLMNLAGSSRVARKVVESTLRACLGALVLGESLKEDVVSFIPYNRIFVLPNAVPDVMRKGNSHIRDITQEIRILFLSNLRPSKGVIEFLSMAKSIVEMHSNVSFVLAGPHRTDRFGIYVKRFIARNGLSDYLEMPGEVYGRAKYQLFSRCHIFVLPSHEEGMPLVLMEAMACGMPVVASNVGAIPEVIEDGKTGFTVPPKDVVHLTERVSVLVRDYRLRAEMGRHARKRYESHYSLAAYERNLDLALRFISHLKAFSKL